MAADASAILLVFRQTCGFQPFCRLCRPVCGPWLGPLRRDYPCNRS